MPRVIQLKARCNSSRITSRVFIGYTRTNCGRRRYRLCLDFTVPTLRLCLGVGFAFGPRRCAISSSGSAPRALSTVVPSSFSNPAARCHRPAPRAPLHQSLAKRPRHAQRRTEICRRVRGRRLDCSTNITIVHRVGLYLELGGSTRAGRPFRVEGVWLEEGRPLPILVPLPMSFPVGGQLPLSHSFSPSSSSVWT